MLRYPNESRTSLGDLRNMRIRTPDGREIPFLTAAVASMERGFTMIRRVDRQRTISITANVDESRANANAVIADLEANFLPALIARNPGVSYSMEGEQRSQRETLDSLRDGLLLALFAIYALLAVPLRSYWQPLIIMSAVPFGFAGAVLGHFILDLPMSVFSLCGMVALAGVVVNDNLVLVDHINQERAAGRSIREAVMNAGVARFRPVWLTSLTTVAGLTPLILEREVQAQFLIPMATSLAAGVLFATATTLVLAPSFYLILDDIAGLFRQPDEQRSESSGATEAEA